MSRYGDDPIDFGPAEDEYRGLDMHGEETARGPLILALAAGVLIVFGAVVWNTYRQGIRGDTGQLPLITSDVGAYKQRPETSGGAEVPDQQLRFYDEMDGSSRAGVELEGGLRRSVSAGLEEPLAGGAGREGLPPPATGRSDSDGLRGEFALGEPVNSASPGTEGQIAVLDEATIAIAADRAADAIEALPDPSIAAPTDSARFEFDRNGAYLVQVAALRDPNGAERAWLRLSSSYPGLFAGAEKRIQRADLGARGVFYRLRVGAFASRDAAAEFCDALKSAGKDCIIVQ